MFKELIKNGKLFGYCIEPNDMFEGGLVIADSEDEAKEKAINAYTKHGYSNSELDNLSVWKVLDGCFDDSPDVFEFINEDTKNHNK